MEYTKGGWVKQGSFIFSSEKPPRLICEVIRSNMSLVEQQNNARLIAAAPLGHKLAEFVARISSTWIDEGLLEIGEGDYIRMKQLALDFLAKAELDFLAKAEGVE